VSTDESYLTGSELDDSLSSRQERGTLIFCCGGKEAKSFDGPVIGGKSLCMKK
jgi:hypothetical protein